ncbi:D-amino-acid N-acetyltransferase [Saxophila tyrrhenica]|uniref:D-amino-acid N-acetyltransferase n=1 Tax=Saxophila tyrrhenica TaxID=1690608 RepID=A0AAV9P1X2_9PEZI|nr:D-amino-acid N-acetyltransferase [Saxophila tyrrhenica]
MAVTIRPITPEDEQRWRTHWAAYNDFYQRTDGITETITATTFSRFLDESSPVQCAVASTSSGSYEGGLVGFVTWYPHPSTDSVEDVVYLNDLFVDPDARNGDVGRKLIEYVYAEADKAGAGKVYWHTQFFNHRAQLLYTKVGKRTDFVMYTRQ